MCKLITLTNVSNVRGLKKLVNKAAALVSETERDGFGYAVQTVRGVYGERTLSPKGFEFSMDRVMLESEFVSYPSYERFGTRGKPSGALICHGRTSTNNVSLLNTHPIQKHGWTLSHNGVVSNHGPAYEMMTTNDTEHLVEYMATMGVSGVEAHLTGYFAFAALDPDGVLHIVRDSIATLYVARIESIDSLIFATKRDHIDEICEEMGWESTLPGLLNDNTHLQFNRGVLESHASISPRGRTTTESSLAHLSLGYAFESEATESTFDESEELFLEEMRLHGDASYKITSMYGRDMTIDDFRALPDEDKLTCTVVRPDGTVCDQTNYYSETLWEGRV